jgi:DNA-3-methyladenine glycosylase II
MPGTSARGYSMVMTDHPAWAPAPGASPALVRAMPAPGGGHALVRADGTSAAWCCAGAAASEPGVFAFPAGAAPELAAPLASLGPVARFASLSLWEAVAAAVIRQVVRAAQARAQYQALCAAYGIRVQCGSLSGWLVPSPQAVLALTDAQFAALGLAFKRRALREAATAFAEHGRTWALMPAEDLATVLPSVRRVGPWTAGVAAADWSNDFSVYPYGDLAVRTWAGRAAPDSRWPAAEPAFRSRWEQAAGPHLAAVTLLTLAWGDHHARTDP